MRLLDLLPEFYANCPQTADLQNALGVELDAVQSARDDCFLQLDVNTATWGLDFWEEAYGIKKDVGKSYEFRRSRIISKMRGTGTVTAMMIKNVAESFSNGEVEVVEHPNQYRFDIRFVGIRGIPPNLDDLKAAIEDIKPAHLAAGYIIIFRTHGELKSYTHAQLSAFTHKQMKEGELT